MNHIMNKTHILSIKKNIVASTIYNFLLVLFNFIGRRLFLAYIGIDYLGISGLFLNVISLLSMADLGVGITINYMLYKPLAEKDYDRISAIIFFYKKIYRIVIATVSILGIAVIPFINLIVNTDKDFEYLEVYYCLFLLNTICSYIWCYKSNVLFADQKNYILNLTRSVILFVKISGQILIMVLLRNYIAYLVWEVVITLLTNLVISAIVSRNYPYLNSQKQLDKSEIISIRDNLKAAFIYRLSAVFMNSVDNILISMIIGTVVVGYIENYLTITKAITIIVGVIFESITASIGNLVSVSDDQKKLKAFRASQLLAFYIATVSFVCLFILSGDLITLWVGRRYVFDRLTVFAISFDLYLGIVMRPLWVYRDATGIYQRTKYIMIIAALLNVVFSIILGNMIGIAGIVLASSLCRIVTYVWYEPIVLYKLFFKCSAVEYFIGNIKNIMVCCVTCAAMYLISDKLDVYTTWIIFVLKGIFVVVCVSITYYVLYRNKEEYRVLMAFVDKSKE